MADVNGISFQRGIDYVSRHQPDDETKLPEAAAFVPGDAAVSHRLDQVLYRPSVEEAALDKLRPSVSDRAILAPGRYGRLSEEAETALRGRLDAAPNDPDNPKFDRLARLLEDERDLRSLLDQSRNVLLKG